MRKGWVCGGVFGMRSISDVNRKTFCVVGSRPMVTCPSQVSHSSKYPDVRLALVSGADEPHREISVPAGPS